MKRKDVVRRERAAARRFARVAVEATMMAQQAADDMPESVRPQEVVARVFATLSTEHLSPWERERGRYSSSTWWLESSSTWWLEDDKAIFHDKAIFVHVDEMDVDSFYEGHRYDGLRAAGEWAAKVGVQWLHFDVDGPIQPGLPRWNDEGDRIDDEYLAFARALSTPSSEQPTEGAP